MYRTVVTICTASLTFTILRSAHTTVVFMCFVWLSEQTAIISLYNINWLVCITERKCVYCAVRTGCLNTVPVIRIFKVLMRSGTFRFPTADKLHTPTCNTRPRLITSHNYTNAAFPAHSDVAFCILQAATDVTEWNSAPSQNVLNAF